MEEKVLTAEGNWKSEAEAVINDIKNHVKNIDLAFGTNEHIFFNLTTIEEGRYHVELSGKGFKIVGNDHNLKNVESEQYFETPYSLLSSVSQSFNKSFGNELFQKLTALKKAYEQENDEEEEDSSSASAGDKI